MRIGIFETDHFEGSYPVIRLFDTGKNDITIFAYRQSWDQFRFLFHHDVNKYRWVIRKEQESKRRFILRMFREARKLQLDLLYLNTISNNHLLYAGMIKLLKNVRVVVTIHDINGYFQFRPSLNWRRWVRYFGKRCLIRSVKEFNVVSVTMVNHLQLQLPPHKKVYAVPGAVYEGRYCPVPSIVSSGRINIVIPGTVDVRRRDYAIVFELLKACRRQSIPVSVVLLGGYYGEEGKQVIEQCKAYSSAYDNLHFYETNVVDQPEFDRKMDEAHLIFIPSRIDTILSDGVQETYGVSISSGNIFDIIKHAKPFIAPAALKLPPNLESGAVRYTQVADITGILQNLMAREDLYDQLAGNALSNAELYTIEKMRAQYPALFEPW